MESTTDYTCSYTFNIRHYKAKGESRCERTLIYDNGDILAREDVRGFSKSGKLQEIAALISDLEQESPANKCTKCRYKVGDYTGDIGYLLYLTFTVRLRLKFIKLKFRLFQLCKKLGFYKDKATLTKYINAVSRCYDIKNRKTPIKGEAND